MTLSEVNPPDVMHILGKEYSAEMLAVTDEPKSAQEISTILDIPIATCYRRIEELEDHGLLIAVETNLETKHNGTRYRRTVDHLAFNFNDSLSVRDGPAVGLKHTLRRAFDRLRPSQ